MNTQNPSAQGQTERRCHQIHVLGRNAAFEAEEHSHVLTGMHKSGQTHVLVGCKGGGCGKCRIKVMDGTYFSKKMSRAHISPREEEQGVVLACRIFARSDLGIVPL
ncbi:2Fe-2S iron-sulfur cluster-binding protein [Parathalassolituus penaei]|uniref:2Fe-2S iron-sulfur cluster-binding protein n=1 Tax=Parathalassolituus penaei TaxID=2997323 RepID=A0A9X3EFI5_9GAMM|nr:2Fe-2S iron-sulfur cluster-binding protein [Parathalassolituus penaei]MCY0966326.1 2Fe-2S iron-sulfur cluster-binding protein [Parathalassolituus penaei]